MVVKLKQWPDGFEMVYQTGKFDDWQVSFWKDGKKSNPTDVMMLEYLFNYDPEEVWSAICTIGYQCYNEFKDIVIPEINGTPQENRFFSYLAAAMVAEEKKENALLGKKVKLIGIYQVLFERMTVNEAANWSKGKQWFFLEDYWKKKVSKKYLGEAWK